MKDDTTGGTTVTLSSRDRLDVNITTTFVELVLTTLDMWARDGTKLLQTARGTFAPYRIRNRTGGTILIWPDIDGKASSSEQTGTQLANEETVDWRFDDWKTTREVCYFAL